VVLGLGEQDFVTCLDARVLDDARDDVQRLRRPRQKTISGGSTAFIS
jgi:hypothetical protein